MKVFLTGGTGNIGQYVTRALLENGHSVKLLTRTPERIPAYLTMPGVTPIKGDILQLDVLQEALQGCDAVVHIALGWGNTPVEMLDHDTRVTAFLAQAAEEAGVANFIYTSSTAAMGSLRDGMDETALLIPGDLYGSTKASAEMYLLGFRQYYRGQGLYGDKVKLRRNIIRPGYTFSNPAVEGGSSQSDTRFKEMTDAIVRNRDITVSKRDGTQFLSARQIAKLYVRLMESDLNEEIFLGLGEKFVSWYDIAMMALELAPDYKGSVHCIDEAASHPALYNVSKMKRIFNLSFAGDEDLRAHVQWNMERSQREMEGKANDNVYHVW
ncbi:MAG: NAD(P)-dependent oxidoreductase [Eubacteriales bacterium]|nr:NAD(P)-dependent oxidoreductase [Eubacteriales bacterium]